MRLRINDEEYELLANGTNITKSICMIRILSSDPTLLDAAFLEAECFMVQEFDEEEYETYENDYDVIYTEVRHNQDLGYRENKDGEYVRTYGDVVTVHLKGKV